MDDIVKDFLIESNENLDRLDQELVKLESSPSSKELLASVFRTIHTIKGSCGFLGFARLEKLTHAGESLLSRLRDGQLTLTSEITSGLLAMVDAVRHMLTAIQASGHDGPDDYAALIQHLSDLQSQQPVASAESTTAPEGSVTSAKDADAATPRLGVAELGELADPAKIGGLLVARGQVAPEDLAVALRVQELGRKRVREILIERGAAHPEDAEMDGLETVRELRKIDSRVPIIMFSTLTERGASVTLEALALGATDYVTKPSNLDGAATFETVIHELLPKVRAFCHLPGRKVSLFSSPKRPQSSHHLRCHAGWLVLPRSSSSAYPLEVQML